MNLNDTTGINSLAIEIKGDGGSIFYDSDVPEDYLSNPSEATSSSLMSKDELSSLFKELQDDGFYVIARVVTFKDAIFASQNPDDSFTDQNGNLVLHNDEYWPSAFSRKAWSYNVDIAKEIAQCNVNEINLTMYVSQMAHYQKLQTERSTFITHITKARPAHYKDS